MKCLVHTFLLVINALLILSSPASASDNLAEGQTKNFRGVHQKLGFGPTEDSFGGRDHGQVIISTDPAVATVRAKSVVANSVSELKELVGNPNSRYENGATRDVAVYPELIKGGDPDPVVLDRAMRAFVFGDSAKLKAAENVINRWLFPLVVTAASSVESIVIKAGEPMIIGGGGPVVINLGELTLEAGAQIIVQTIAKLNVQMLVVKGDATIDASGLPGIPGKQGAGGRNGADGSKDASGGNGSAGLDGSIGGAGHDGYHLLLMADEISGGGSILFKVNGGNGGAGVQGGKGGKGGSLGQGGRGGNGGQGGDGGNGGIGQLF